MCGIAAIINPTITGGVEMELMLAKLRHRGDCVPNYTYFGNSIMGNVRLKIVDAQNGMQPFYNEDQTIAVIFNGEIYNYKKIKKELEKKGHSFKSDCDTEVLVHLYEEDDINFLHKLEGMFAFLLFDLSKNIFWGIRDFFGVKPFFYCKNGATIYIASEMKAFIDLNVNEFEELKPGHYITNSGIERYYTVPQINWDLSSEKILTQTVRKLLEDSVKKRVQTDLPIAVFLSGGIDSTIIHLLCCKYHSDVTGIIIGEDSAEDVIYAKRFCTEFNFKFEHVKINRQSLLDNIENIIYSIETFEPNPVRGSLLSMELGKVAHNLGFKVTLCGEGSDEIFGGYGDFLLIDNEIEFQNEIENLLKDLNRTQLLRIDKTAMRFAVEVREPFLDRALVEYVLNIHPKHKVALNKNGKKITKYILREAFKDLLPNYIYSRQKMTLMEGAGIGSLEKEDGILSTYANACLADEDYIHLCEKFSKYCLKNKEEAYCFGIFNQYYSRAKFAINRVINAQKEIIRMK